LNKRLLSEDPRRVYSLHFEQGEEAITELDAFARDEDLGDASFTGIGALQAASLSRYNHETEELEPILLDDEQVEVLSMIGEISDENGRPHVHVHVVLGRADGTTRGGHLVRAIVRPMLILTVTESAVPITRHHP
jgi:uncharacterized protein